MLKRHKSLSIVMTLCLCLALMAPVFVAPPVAQAAMTATVQTSNTVLAAGAQNLGSFRVDLTNLDAFTTGSQLLISFPTIVGQNAGTPAVATIAPTFNIAGAGIQIVVPVDTDNAITAGDLNGGALAASQANGTIGLAISDVSNAKDKGWFYIYFYGVDTSNFAGDFNVTLIPQSGTAFGTSPVPLTVGRVNVTGKTTTVAKSVYPISSTAAGAPIDTITIFEDIPNTIAPQPATALPAAITLEIQTKGYTWGATVPGITGLFNFALGGATLADGGRGAANTERYVNVTAIGAGRTSVGAIGVTGLTLLVDEDVARVGQDVEVKVSGAGVTEQVITVAKYVDFSVLINEDTTTELISGREEQKIGNFFIEEVAPGSLVGGRNILMELPAGLQWNRNFAATNSEVVNNSACTFTAGNLMNNNRTIKLTVNGNGSQGSVNGAKIKIKELKVDVSPSYAGDVTINISGTAGAKGEVKVATVTPMVTLAAEAPEVQLGIADQKVADVTITESKVQAICDKDPVVGARLSLAFRLDQGFRFAKVPKVEVLEGDLVLDTTNIKITAPANDNLLIVPVKAGSYKTPAKIKISDIYVTADRTAPTGDVKFWLASTNQYTDVGGGALVNAANSTRVGNFQYDSPGSVVVAKNVTVPPVENKNVGLGGSGTFVIGSNIYTVNGMTKIMDTAPYITSGRTYVPYRYLALALGVAPEDIVWDDSTKKVTVTKGDIVVEATIGSTTLTVNGEAQVMDVAPEIKGGRTMLPARYLAEALGGSVGWDQATKTVVFEM